MSHLGLILLCSHLVGVIVVWHRLLLMLVVQELGCPGVAHSAEAVPAPRSMVRVLTLQIWWRHPLALKRLVAK